MDRLDFVLPDFTRVAWVSEEARLLWEDRISRISKLFLKIERESVVSMGRSCIQSYDPQELPSILAWVKEQGLVLLPMEVNAKTETYSATPQAWNGNTNSSIRAVICPVDKVGDWHHAWRNNDHKAIGKLLHFPDCCVDFFMQYWIDEKFVDTTWQQAEESFCAVKTSDLNEIKNYLGCCNVLWRWLGVRAVPHLPCSFVCSESDTLGNRLWKNYKNYEEYLWLAEIIHWPVEWSALHGIARIKTPILEISTRTDATGEKYTVQFKGKVYPEVGATGLVFPYRRVQAVNDNHYLWLDNGFKTFHDMTRAHLCIEHVAMEVKNKNLVDFGCGNGTLLHKLGTLIHADLLLGIEVEELKVERGKALYDEIEFVNSNLNDLESVGNNKTSIAIVSVNRLKENPKLIQLLTTFPEILIYSYDGLSVELPIENEYYKVTAHNSSYGKANLYRRR